MWAGWSYLAPGDSLGIEGYCDNVNNNPDRNSRVDEGCDRDNDGYCRGTLTTSAGISITPFTCPHGGGDCQDAAVPGNERVNPGVPGSCPAA